MFDREAQYTYNLHIAYLVEFHTAYLHLRRPVLAQHRVKK